MSFAQRRVNTDPDPYPPVKITFVGDATVGKTSLVERLVRNRFSESTSSTIGAAFIALPFKKNPQAKSRMYHIWDTAGQERFSSLIPLYVSGAQVIVVVYDITKRCTFDRIGDHWLKYIRQNLRLLDDAPLPMIYLLGNKRDLAAAHRAVNSDEAQRFAEEHDMGFIEVSAKTGEGAIEVFHNIATHADDLVIRQADALKLSRGVFDEEAPPGCCSGAVANLPSMWWGRAD